MYTTEKLPQVYIVIEKTRRGSGGLSSDFTPGRIGVGCLIPVETRLPRLGIALLPETGQAPSLHADEFQVRKILSWLTRCCRVEANSSTSVAERFNTSGSRIGMRFVPTASRRTWISKACSA